jgi:hypothetical protein
MDKKSLFWLKSTLKLLIPRSKLRKWMAIGGEDCCTILPCIPDLRYQVLMKQDTNHAG